MKKLFFALCLMSACLLAIPGHAAEKKHLKIVYVEWDCATASTYLAKAVLEDRFGYTVEAVPVSNAVMWGALASGDADVSVTAWLPVTAISLPSSRTKSMCSVQLPTGLVWVWPYPIMFL